jgi:hypothetical protein
MTGGGIVTLNLSVVLDVVLENRLAFVKHFVQKVDTFLLTVLKANRIHEGVLEQACHLNGGGHWVLRFASLFHFGNSRSIEGMFLFFI